MTLETLVNDYKAKTSRSRQMYEEALRVMPGGNSRTTTFFDPYPFYITRGAGRAHLGRRRRRAPRLQRQLHEPDPWPRASLGRRGRHRAGHARHVLPGTERARGEAGGAADDAHPEHGGGALRQLGHRGDDERGARGARLHGPEQARQVRGRLPRHARLGAGERLARSREGGLAQAAEARGLLVRACPTRCSSTRWSCRGTMPTPA